MKTLPARLARAFTLIELITVIAILSILMALLIPHIMAARTIALRNKASTILMSTNHACLAYKQDYGKFPPVEAALDGGVYSYGEASAGCRTTNDALFNVLRAIAVGENANHALNSRQTKYLESGKATDPKRPRDGFGDGSEFASQAGRLLDPWGSQYCIVLDADGDDLIDMGRYFSDLSGNANALRFAAAGFSLGKDGQRGGTGYAGKFKKPNSSESPDDIATWN